MSNAVLSIFNLINTLLIKSKRILKYPASRELAVSVKYHGNNK